METEEHYLQRELYGEFRRSSTIFEFLQLGSLDGIWYWDLQKPEHEWLSPRFWELLGFDPAEMPHLAAAWQDLVHPDDLETALENLARHQADPRHPYDQVVRYRHKNGSWVWVRCRGIALRDDNGNPVRMLGAHTDLTELKRTEEELRQEITKRKLAEEKVRQLTADLQHASRLSVMGEMAAGVAHELHQPLAVIVNYANGCRNRLEERKFDVQKMADSMEEIASAAMSAGQIIKHIMAFISKEQFEPEVLDVNEAVRDALELAKLAVREEAVIVKANLSENLPQVAADRIQVIQVVLNLVLNGIEAMTEVERVRRKLTVRTLVDSDQCVRVEVADVGHGVQPDEGKKLFEQFVTSKPHGLGIGLSISRTIVEAHGGRIWFESEPPSGSVFRFTLPPIGQM